MYTALPSPGTPQHYGTPPDSPSITFQPRGAQLHRALCGRTGTGTGILRTDMGRAGPRPPVPFTPAPFPPGPGNPTSTLPAPLSTPPYTHTSMAPGPSRRRHHPTSARCLAPTSVNASHVTGSAPTHVTRDRKATFPLPPGHGGLRGGGGARHGTLTTWDTHDMGSPRREGETSRCPEGGSQAQGGTWGRGGGTPNLGGGGDDTRQTQRPPPKKSGNEVGGLTGHRPQCQAGTRLSSVKPTGRV